MVIIYSEKANVAFVIYSTSTLWVELNDARIGKGLILSHIFSQEMELRAGYRNEIGMTNFNSFIMNRFWWGASRLPLRSQKLQMLRT